MYQIAKQRKGVIYTHHAFGEIQPVERRNMIDYIFVTNQIEVDDIDIPQEMRNIFWRVSSNGSKEERAFDHFVNLAGGGFNHPDRYFYLYQGRLDAYEDVARLELMKAEIVRDEELLTKIRETEQELHKLNI